MMIAQMDIENFALFKKSRFAFKPGLNVLSGESGAGKSLALESIAVLFGGRLSHDRIGPWSEQTRIRAVLDLPEDDPIWESLTAIGLDRDSVLIVERTSGKDGRSTYRLQGQPAPAGVVRALGESLLQYVGQNQLSKTFTTEYLVDWLDDYSGLEQTAAAVRQAYTAFRQLEREFRELEQLGRGIGELEDKRRTSQELHELALSPDEDVLLSQELNRLRAGRTLIETGRALYQRMDGSDNGGGLLADLDAAVHLADTLVHYDPSLANSLQSLQQALRAVGDARLEISEWMEKLDLDPARLEQLEVRADELSRAKRRFGPELEDVFRFLAELDRDISQLENLDWEQSRVAERLDRARNLLQDAAETLSGARQHHLERASEELTARIREMEMPTGTIRMERTGGTVSARGVDALDLVFSASQGQEARSISKAASGGEVARVALALAVTGRPRSDVVFMFDEVDQGLGGASAERVGWLLRRLGAGGQVLSVSHQAVVAARAHHHLEVSKVVEGDHSVSHIQVVEDNQRVREIARMLSGSADERALNHARMLVNEGQEE